MTVQGNILGFPILSLITYLPLVGAILLLFVGRERIGVIRNLAFVSSLASFAVSLLLPFNYDQSTAAVQFVEQRTVDPEHRGDLLLRAGRHQPVAGHADHVPVADRRPVLL